MMAIYCEAPVETVDPVRVDGEFGIAALECWFDKIKSIRPKRQSRLLYVTDVEQVCSGPMGISSRYSMPSLTCLPGSSEAI